MWLRGDRAGLEDAVRVESIQSVLLTALKTHCRARYGRDSAPVMVGRLLGQLVELRSVGRLAGDLLTSALRTTNDSTELATLRRIISMTDRHDTLNSPHKA